MRSISREEAQAEEGRSPDKLEVPVVPSVSCNQEGARLKPYLWAIGGHGVLEAGVKVGCRGLGGMKLKWGL